MKTSIKTIAAALVLLGMVGSASAMTKQQDVFSGVQAAIGSGSNVQVTLNGDVATLSGYAEGVDRKIAANAALKSGAGKVVNLITQSN